MGHRQARALLQDKLNCYVLEDSSAHEIISATLSHAARQSTFVTSHSSTEERILISLTRISSKISVIYLLVFVGVISSNRRKRELLELNTFQQQKSFEILSSVM